MDKQELKNSHEAKEELANEELKAQFARSHAWHLVKQSLLNKIIELDSVSATIDKYKKNRNVDEIRELMYTNGIAVGIVVDWINEIETMGGVMEGNLAREAQEKKKEQILVELPE